MRDDRVESGIVRRRWLRAFVTGVTLFGGGARLEGQCAHAGGTRAHLTLRTARRVRAIGSVPGLWPVHGAVTSRFGWRRSPIGGKPDWHPGVDIVAPFGTPVRATGDGVVAFAGRARGYGAMVVVEHGVITTRYAHLSAIWVRAGQRVLVGKPVGAVGRTGRATAPHLHYEVRLGTEALDPQCVLAGWSDRGETVRTCVPVRDRFDSELSPSTGPDPTEATPPRAGMAG
jgi:hypothetical protein